MNPSAYSAAKVDGEVLELVVKEKGGKAAPGSERSDVEERWERPPLGLDLNALNMVNKP